MVTRCIHSLILITVILFFICLIGALFEILINKTSHFYRVDEICPSLCTINSYISRIKMELSKVNAWRDWPEKFLYPNGSWKIVPIYAFGKWCKPYSDQVPTLTNLLKKIPGLKTALFSRMDPYTKLNPHQGWAVLSNCIIRCHLGIDIHGESYVAVGNERRYHENGKWFAFDDSRMHYGCNLSGKARTVLIVDVARPPNIRKGISRVKTSGELLGIIKDVLEKKGD